MPRYRVRRAATNKWWIIGGAALIDVSTPKHPRAVALIDRDDLDRVVDGCGRWSAYQPRHVVYAGRRSGETSQRMHHVIRVPIPDLVLDHREGDGLDNRKQSLRYATPTQNAANASKAVKPRTSGFKGVSRKTPNEMWQAEITINRTRVFLGLFDDEIEAARKYDVAAVEHFGDFARLNFPSSVGA